jgi:HSP20 family molecular chaperone IbpA
MARYDPFEEMDRVFEQLRTRMWTPDGFGRSDFATPAFGGGINMDLKKHGDGFGSHATEGSSLRRRDGEYVFVSDLTGFETDEIDLRFEGDALVLAAETRLSDETTGDETASDEMMGDAIMGGEMTGDESAGEQMAGEETTSEKTTTDTDEIGVRREFTRSRRVSERVTIPRRSWRTTSLRPTETASLRARRAEAHRTEGPGASSKSTCPSWRAKRTRAAGRSTSRTDRFSDGSTFTQDGFVPRLGVQVELSTFGTCSVAAGAF